MTSSPFGGLDDARLGPLTEATDVRFVTYYFIGNEFGGTPADNVAGNLAAMIDYAGDKPLALKEMFSIMFDRSRAWCEETAAYYGFPDDEAFIQFLCTLGLRSYDDQAKPGWDQLASEAAARGF